MSKPETLEQFADRMSPETALQCYNIATISNNIVEITRYSYYKTWNGYDTRPSNVLKYSVKLNKDSKIIDYKKL